MFDPFEGTGCTTACYPGLGPPYFPTGGIMPMVRLLAIAAIAVAAACGNSTSYGSPPPPPPPPPPPSPGGHSTTITVGNNSTNSFSPTPDTVVAGTVTFHWAS